MSRGVRRALFTVAYYWNNQRQIASWVGLLTVPEKCFCKTALSTYLYSRLPLLLIQSTSPSSILVVCFIPLSCLVAQQTDVSDLMSPSQWKKSQSPLLAPARWYSRTHQDRLPETLVIGHRFLSSDNSVAWGDTVTLTSHASSLL